MKGHAMTKAPTKTAPKAEPLTKFRVHYRTSQNADKAHHDVAAKDIGEAHDATRALFKDKPDVRVFIDKVKVLRAA